jgi:hypothetical protein
VDNVLSAQQRESEASGGGKAEHWKRQCEALDRQIDALVYELYGLTDDEIQLVESAQYHTPAA